MFKTIAGGLLVFAISLLNLLGDVAVTPDALGINFILALGIFTAGLDDIFKNRRINSTNCPSQTSPLRASFFVSIYHFQLNPTLQI